MADEKLQYPRHLGLHRRYRLMYRRGRGTRTSTRIVTGMHPPSMGWTMVEAAGEGGKEGEHLVENRRTEDPVGKFVIIFAFCLYSLLDDRKRRSSPGLDDLRGSKRR